MRNNKNKQKPTPINLTINGNFFHEERSNYIPLTNHSLPREGYQTYSTPHSNNGVFGYVPLTHHSFPKEKNQGNYKP